MVRGLWCHSEVWSHYRNTLLSVKWMKTAENCLLVWRVSENCRKMFTSMTMSENCRDLFASMTVSKNCRKLFVNMTVSENYRKLFASMTVSENCRKVFASMRVSENCKKLFVWRCLFDFTGATWGITKYGSISGNFWNKSRKWQTLPGQLECRS